jgi:hypothetical protein
MTSSAGSQPPRLLVKTLGVILITVALLLVVVFVVVFLSVRDQVRIRWRPVSNRASGSTRPSRPAAARAADAGRDAGETDAQGRDRHLRGRSADRERIPPIVLADHDRQRAR